MIHQPPAGARDLLPLEVAQKGWINDSLQEVFQRWGYQRIVTSTIEWLDTLMAGGAIEQSKVIQLMDSSEGRLGLRPELTASIARAAVTRMEANTTQRLCYRANVFRNPPNKHGRQLEFYQAGVELLFAKGVLADGEIILLLTDCLHKLGIKKWYLILGEAGLTRSLLAPFPESLRKQVRTCIANLDRVSLENLPLAPELKQRALLLFDLRGKPTAVLEKVGSLDLDESGRDIVNNLKFLVELLHQTSPNPLPLILDLSIIQSIDYYTGIVFEAVSLGECQPHILGRGGRYDELLGVYHPQGKGFPGIGFALNIEDLHASLVSTAQLPQAPPASDWLVIAQTEQAMAAAFIYAQKLRRSEHLVRVEIDLGGRSEAEIREYAQDSRINRLAWVQTDGHPVIEFL
ncbi:MAG: ATP phosphoribosyltransferase regulatory subunit [Gomphosphaeria aponina SAG 52.96 = DSM 107014]|uniref:ATP phosphoribosyltransferase regulatory subunit n=1 Tax=Gomphosphaeria aponina SAG 52.96 = DSM 107014 TaxID=1521640 RepID=A0A941GNX6_9CHRO|nr:ATP phosphoribosyltransferase regulatory subunit [Gomphosphaeria aponina SAG 52.96 = DSM 107014]